MSSQNWYIGDWCLHVYTPVVQTTSKFGMPISKEISTQYSNVYNLYLAQEYFMVHLQCYVSFMGFYFSIIFTNLFLYIASLIKIIIRWSFQLNSIQKSILSSISLFPLRMRRHIALQWVVGSLQFSYTY